MKPKRNEYCSPTLKRWSSALTVLMGILLIVSLCALLAVHHLAQAKANGSARKLIINDTNRMATIMGYYYAHCRKEVELLAQSRPVQGLLDGSSPALVSQQYQSKRSKLLQNSVQQLLAEKPFIGLPRFTRLCIIQSTGALKYDSMAKGAATTTWRINGEEAPKLTKDGDIHTNGNELFITAIAGSNRQPLGYVAAWLNIEAAYRRFLAGHASNSRSYGLMTDSGRVFLPDRMPYGFRSDRSDELKAISPNTLTTITVPGEPPAAHATEYLAMVVPIDQTPLQLLTLMPASAILNKENPWHYGIIVAVLLAILTCFYILQQRIDRRNTELMTRYTEAQMQYRIMVQDNEDLANEVLLRKRAESELKIINDYLEEIVTHRTRKLKGALEELQTTQSQLIQSGKLASIGELAAGIAHELNQPLMVIRGNAQLMTRMQKRSKDVTEQLPSLFDTIERNTKRMIMIINHLRSFSRQSSNDFQDVDINQVINDAFLMIGEQMRLHNIEAIKNLAEDLPYIHGDPYALEQVFLNLLTNARDAIDAFQTDADAYHRIKKEIEITTRLKNGEKKMVEILFRDTGCGIEPKDMEKIFDPFFTTKEVGKGTGLGLSISYGILQQHGGHLEFVDTTPGNTTLIVVLPAAK